MSKICSRCGLEKPLTEFGKNKQNHNRPDSWCRQCKRDKGAEFRKTPAGIYQQLKGQITFGRKYKNKRLFNGYLRGRRRELLCTQDEFVKWYEAQPKVCAYCGISEDKLMSLPDVYNRNLTRLSVDAIDNNKDYSIDNIILACRRCNAVKSDFFTHDEMLKIGKIIKTHWDGSG